MSAPKRAFSLKAPGSVRILRVCGVIDLICAIPLTFAGVCLWIAVPIVAAGSDGLSWVVEMAAICLLGGLMATWAGLSMIHSQVVVTPTQLVSGGTPRIVRRCPRDQIVSVDVCQLNFGRAPRAVPVAVRRDGSDILLLPLAILLSRANITRQLETQRVAVDALRQELGVGGVDLAPSQVRWTETRAALSR